MQLALHLRPTRNQRCRIACAGRSTSLPEVCPRPLCGFPAAAPRTRGSFRSVSFSTPAAWTPTNWRIWPHAGTLTHPVYHSRTGPSSPFSTNVRSRRETRKLQLKEKDISAHLVFVHLFGARRILTCCRSEGNNTEMKDETKKRREKRWKKIEES